jgi:hypothetical protein
VTWLAPGYLLAGALAALAVVALHLLAWRRPPTAALPTARFIPDAPARARARSTRPADPWLLALRALALLLASAALARPVRVRPRVPLARVVVADRSGSAGDAAAVDRALAEAHRPGDATVLLDSSARGAVTEDALAVRLAGMRVGRQSPALVLARDAAARLADAADSVELVLISPLAREEMDAATAPLVAAWNGRVRVIPVASARPLEAPPTPISVDAPPDDAVAAAVLASAVRTRASVRLVRRAATSADSAWLRESPGRVLVAWPAVVARADAASDALAWDDDAMVAPIARDGTASAGRVVARWADGRAAATEREVGNGCIREVRVALPRAGDVTLSTAFARLLAHLAAPCGGARHLAPVDPMTLGIRATGPARALPRPAPRDPWQVARWLLGAAIALLLVEPLLRRGAGTSELSPSDTAAADRSAHVEAA